MGVREPLPVLVRSLGRSLWRGTGGSLNMLFGTRNLVGEKRSPLVIHPSSRAKLFFDALLAVSVAGNAVLYPLQAAFGLPSLRPYNTYTDVIFLLDVALGFFTGFEDCGTPVLSLSRVAPHYLRGHFATDFFCALPWQRMLEGATPLWAFGGYWFWPLRILRVRRVVRVLAMETSGTVLRVVWALAVWVLVAHSFACAWFVLGWATRCSVYGVTWVSVHFAQDERFAYLPLSTCSPSVMGGGGYESGARLEAFWLGGESLGWIRPNEKLTIYVKSLYWALATTSSLGYGSGPRAHTDAEFAMSAACQVCGAVMYASIFGNIAQLLRQSDALGASYKAQQQHITEFCSFHAFPPPLRRKLHRYNKFLFSVNRGFDVGQIAGALPANLRLDVMFHMHAKLVESVPIFAGVPEPFIKALVCALKPQVLLKGDCAFHLDDVSTEMYFIQV